MFNCRKLFVLISLLLLVCGCSAHPVDLVDVNESDVQTVVYYNAYDQIDESKMLVGIAKIETADDLNDALCNFENADHVIIGRILSIDGGSNVNEIDGGYTSPYTFGVLEVMREFKGEFETSEISYVRIGGIVPYEDYYASLSPSQQEKRDNLGDEPEYMKLVFENDVEIEPGKVYLMYLKESVTNPDYYAIVFLQAGLREIDEESAASATSDGQIRVYNNITQQWDTLSEVIPGLE